MNVLGIFTNPANPNNFRPHESDNMSNVFGHIYMTGLQNDWIAEQKQYDCNTIFWKLSAERTTQDLLDKALRVAKSFDALGINQINHPKGWLNVRAKDICFDTWNKNNISCPEYFTFTDKQDFESKCNFDFPYLVRLNSSNTGEHSYWIHSEEDLSNAWGTLLTTDRLDFVSRWGSDVALTNICVKFIDFKKYGVRYSYRIHVAGNKVISGYARACKPDKWIAITREFQTGMESEFIKLNLECHEFMETHKDDLIKAVQCLGLNWQGIDVIFDADGNHYYLEVQPDYFCGNPRYGDKPPWYNPSYPDLVKFINDNDDMMREKLPMYYYNWLDKNNHFDLCQKALKEYFNV